MRWKRPWIVVSLIVGLTLPAASCVQSCKGVDCAAVLICTATQEEADRLNATDECRPYGYCPWVARDGGADADGAADAHHDAHEASADADASEAAPDSGHPVDPAGWVCDPSIWSPVPNGGDQYGFYQADLAKWCLPARTWSSCGAGCLIGQAPLVYGTLGTSYRGTAAAGYLHGDLYVRLEDGWKNPPEGLVHVTRVSDGTVVAAILHRDPIHASGYGSADVEPLLLPHWVQSKTDSDLIGHAPLAGSAAGIQWQTAWLPGGQQIEWFDDFLDSGFWGKAWYGGDLGVVSSLDAGNWTYIEQGGLYKPRVQARHGLVIYSKLDPSVDGFVINGWTPQGGTMALVSQPGATIEYPALSDEHLVWTAGGGPDYHHGDGPMSFLDMYWSPVPKKPSDVVVTKGPSLLPVNTQVMDLQTAGDYAAGLGLTVDDDSGVGRTQLLVVQLSTKKLWRIAPPAGHWYLQVLAVAPTEILLAANDEPYDALYDQYFKWLVRLDTAHLDEQPVAP